MFLVKLTIPTERYIYNIIVLLEGTLWFARKPTHNFNEYIMEWIKILFGPIILQLQYQGNVTSTDHMDYQM